MTPRDISVILADRAAQAGIAIPEALAVRLLAYHQLLSHWNRKINLTSLSNIDEAVDRLLLEPVAAAAHLARSSELIDLGSGGGSPAIPLALALGVQRLVMVESRARKAAFLREALREVGLAGSVEIERFEDIGSRQGFRGAFGLVSVRAVRLDDELFRSVAAFLKPQGQAALFGSGEPLTQPVPAPLSRVLEVTLAGPRSVLTILQKPADVPRETP